MQSKLRDALAALLRDSDAMGGAPLEYIRQQLDHRWPAPGEKSDWPALQRVLDAVEALEDAAFLEGAVQAREAAEAEQAELVDALREAEAGLELAVSKLPTITTGSDFVPAEILSLRIIRAVLAKLPAPVTNERSEPT